MNIEQRTFEHSNFEIKSIVSLPIEALA